MENAPVKQWPCYPKEGDDSVQLWPNGWVSYRHHGRYHVRQQGMLCGESLFRQICHMLKANAFVAWVFALPEIFDLLAG